MRLNANKKGITLMELIIAIGLVAVISVAAYSVLSTGIRLSNHNVTSFKSQSGMRTAMMQMAKQIKNADAGSIDATAPGLLRYTNSTGAHSFQVINGELKQDMHTGNDKTIAYDIQSLQASYANDTVTITLTGTDGSTLSTQVHAQ